MARQIPGIGQRWTHVDRIQNFCNGAVARARAGQNQSADESDHDGDLYWTGALWMANVILEYVEQEGADEDSETKVS